ncbi:MAG TPA: hypothetical protein VF100_08170, partial [Thermoanaerobaculia bacterium]
MLIATRARTAAALGVALLGAGGPAACERIEPPAFAGAPPPAAAPPSGVPAAAPSAAACYLGVVLASESVEVVAEVAGRVRDVAVRPGDDVVAGAPLA